MAAAHDPCLACHSAEYGANAPLPPLYTAHGNGRSVLCEETEDELLELRASNVQLQEEMSRLKAEVGVSSTWHICRRLVPVTMGPPADIITCNSITGLCIV